MAGRRIRPAAYLLIFLLFGSIIFLSHAPVMTLPYFWDEMGHFVPAAYDVYRHGALVPRSATPNVHPPGVMLYLAVFWSFFGVSVPATRVAMLLLASGAALAAFLLAIQLCRDSRGAPALIAAGLLLASPWFYSQSMLAQLDMPAMALTALALLLFLQERLHASVAVCMALVLVKETSVIVPALLGGWLLLERRPREASWFLLPFAVLALWLVYLARSTGHLFGDAEFTRYNAWQTLHPGRIAFAVLRRGYMLFVGGFHWIGTVAILYALRFTRLFAGRAWRLAAALTGAHLALFCLFGGAVLERYLMPVLPILYAAMAAAFMTLPGIWRHAAPAAALAGVLASNFIDPPYPYPLENNMAFIEFIDLQKTAAGFLEGADPAPRAVAVWPLSAALRNPQLGYVTRGLRVRHATALDESIALDPDEVAVSFNVDRERTPLPFVGWARELSRRVHGYREPLPAYGLAGRLHLIARWSRGGRWIEIYGPR
jgi:hypothetical protein